ncbi:hypothetical protein [Methanosarcina sp. UBA5]|uniref:hypothetical protein n=1 Tax=Methanosarcina sp. UBA5 TaxID=1915593 RepID=UPI0025F95308|nr:hypothetical protein [Methanosarcina sp. UBA5]
MAFKNINTATNQILGRVAGTQHHSWGIRNPARSEGRSIYSRPMEFEEWFNRGLKVYESRGWKFKFLDLITVQVTLPDGRKGKRSIEDFHDEWQQDYCTQFPSCA